MSRWPVAWDSQADVGKPTQYLDDTGSRIDARRAQSLMQGTAHVEAPGLYVKASQVMCGSLQRARARQHDSQHDCRGKTGINRHKSYSGTYPVGSGMPTQNLCSIDV